MNACSEADAAHLDYSKLKINPPFGQYNSTGQKFTFAEFLPCTTYCVSPSLQGLPLISKVGIIIPVLWLRRTRLSHEVTRPRSVTRWEMTALSWGFISVFPGLFPQGIQCVIPVGWPLKVLQFQECPTSQWLHCWVRIIGWPREKHMSRKEMSSFVSNRKAVSQLFGQHRSRGDGCQQAGGSRWMGEWWELDSRGCLHLQDPGTQEETKSMKNFPGTSKLLNNKIRMDHQWRSTFWQWGNFQKGLPKLLSLENGVLHVQSKVWGGLGKAKTHLSVQVPGLCAGRIDRRIKYCSLRSWPGKKCVFHAIFPMFEVLRY